MTLSNDSKNKLAKERVKFHKEKTFKNAVQSGSFGQCFWHSIPIQ
jgi:hypothetical protein